jgi:hypothetical protein
MKVAEMLAEYDFGGAERGRLQKRFGRGAVLVALGPEVTKAFGDVETAQEVLEAVAAVLGRARRRAAASHRRPKPGRR